jgi:hypothetical protein
VLPNHNHFTLLHTRKNPVTNSLPLETIEVEIAVLPQRDPETDAILPTGGVGGGVYFGPASRRLRGRFSVSMLSTADPSERLKVLMNRVNEIPGEIVYIDLAKKQWGIRDPLHKPKEDSVNAKKVAAIRKTTKEAFGQEGEVKTSPTTAVPLKSEDDVKNILYWVRRLIDERLAEFTPTSGKMPLMEAIEKLPGRRIVGYGTSVIDEASVQHKAKFDLYVPATSGKG